MDNSNRIVPPHLNAEVYRTDTTGTSKVSYFDYVCINTDNSVLIGCSELTGRYWNGGAIIYKSVLEGQRSHNEVKKSIYLTSGSADGCFVGEGGKILLCEDSGSVSIWSASCDDAWRQWSEDVSVAEHDDAALAVACLHPEHEYVTAGADGNLKVWDINEMICIRNYTAAHSMAVYSVAVRPQTNNCFASGSIDEYISLWDDNVSKPVIDLVQNNCGIRCVQWINENKLVFGDEAGVLTLVDARCPNTTTKLADFPAAIHKIAIHDKSDKMAVCCDNKIVTVCSLNEHEESKVIYHDRHLHGNYVRGLAWDRNVPNVLHTVAWDGEIITHNIVSE